MGEWVSEWVSPLHQSTHILPPSPEIQIASSGAPAGRGHEHLYTPWRAWKIFITDRNYHRQQNQYSTYPYLAGWRLPSSSSSSSRRETPRYAWILSKMPTTDGKVRCSSARQCGGGRWRCGECTIIEQRQIRITRQSYRERWEIEMKMKMLKLMPSTCYNLSGCHCQSHSPRANGQRHFRSSLSGASRQHPVWVKLWHVQGKLCQVWVTVCVTFSFSDETFAMYCTITRKNRLVESLSRQLVFSKRSALQSWGKNPG